MTRPTENVLMMSALDAAEVVAHDVWCRHVDSCRWCRMPDPKCRCENDE